MSDEQRAASNAKDYSSLATLGERGDRKAVGEGVGSYPIAQGLCQTDGLSADFGYYQALHRRRILLL